MNRGFTVIELVMSMAIFGFMTALVVAKFGNFNQSTLLTDTAYDVALAVHTAQTYGISVKNLNSGTFSPAYGVDFSTAVSGVACGATSNTNNTNMVLFADISPSTPDGLCDISDATVTNYKLLRGATISALCTGTGASLPPNCSNSINRLDISFLRPNPEALICDVSPCTTANAKTYAQITIRATDGSTRTVAVRRNGQVTVLNQ